jgi:hypothetical protein
VAKMPRYEKLRNMQLRGFQKKVLRAVGPPRRSRLWTFLNSAFVIWCLSAILLTVGGGYITNHQQCMRDADQIIDRRSHLALELFSRRAAFATRVSEAKTLQPPFLPGKQGSLYSDLSGIPYGEVEKEFLLLIKRIEQEEFPDAAMRDAQVSWLDFNSSRVDREFEKAQQSSLSFKPDEALKEFKITVELQSLYDDFNRDLDMLAYYYQPDCTILKTLGTALGYKPQIVRATISPLFSLPDTHAFLKEDVDQIEKRQREIGRRP